MPCYRHHIGFGHVIDLVVSIFLAHEAPQWPRHICPVGALVTQIKGDDWGSLQGQQDLSGSGLPFQHLGCNVITSMSQACKKPSSTILGNLVARYTSPIFKLLGFLKESQSDLIFEHSDHFLVSGNPDCQLDFPLLLQLLPIGRHCQRLQVFVGP